MKKLQVLGGVFLGVLAGLFFVGFKSAQAALPANFQATQIIGSGLNGPTGFGVAPDGRVFILERAGAVKIYKGGQLLPTPFTTLPSAASGDRGLIGVTFDPNFAQNHFVYFYYTSAGDLLNRIVRFDATGDVATAEGAVEIYKTTIPAQFLHSGGTIAFGPDGKLYSAIGDNGYPPNAQDLSTPYGKILRLNPDGSAPSDNPFVTTPGALPEIWAYGFRNPWRYQFDSLTGKMYGGDVGEATFEELNEIVRGQNYGWPICEGYCTVGGYKQPLYAYAHTGPSSAVTGGPVYRGSMFPAEYQGSWFFADYGQGFIKRAIFDGAGNIASVQDFDIGAGSVVDLHTAGDGSLYYITFYPGRMYRINYSTGNHIPVAVASSDVSRGLNPLTVHFSSNGSFDPDANPLQYAWNFGDGTTSQEANPTKTFTQVGTYVVELTVSDGTATVQAVPLVIQVGQVPTVTIGNPLNNSLFNAGDTILFSAHGVDGAGFDLSDANFSTEVLFHHHDHIHPFLGPIQAKNGSFVIPTTGEPDPDIWYEIRVTGTDANGLSATATASIYPRKSTITFLTNPSGLDINIDGSPVRTPTQVLGVVGFQREITAPSQGSNNSYYVFDRWSDGGTATHTVAFPATDTTLTAYFKLGNSQCDAVGVSQFVGCYHANKTLNDLRLIRTDPQIHFRWGSGSPGVGMPVDDFSVRWSGDFTFEAGLYDFTTETDDGRRLYVDGVLLQDFWSEQAVGQQVTRRTMTAGVHRVVLEYFEGAGDASANVSWVKTGAPPTPVVNCTEPNVNTFNACYFYQRDFVDFKLNRTEAYPLNFDWGAGSPDPVVPVDNFSATYLGQFTFNAGNYDFTVTGDDGVRLYIDGTLVLDKWIDQSPHTYTVTRTLSAGLHTIKLEYYENGGGAVAKLSWVETGNPPPPPTGGCATPGVNAFTGCYYNNKDFTALAVTRTENYPLNFDWDLGSPDASVDPDTFSAVYSGQFTFEAGDYIFTVSGDDGVRLSVDGQVVLDKFFDQPVTTYTVTKILTAGNHIVKLEYYDNYWKAAVGLSWIKSGTPPPPPVGQSVVSFSLINADTDQVIAAFDPLVPGVVLNLATLPTRNLNIRANTNPATVGSVRFGYDGIANFRLQDSAPYALASDNDGDYAAWTPTVGSHTVTATPYTGTAATGIAGTALSLTFVVTDGTPPPPPTGACPAAADEAFTACYYNNIDFTNLAVTRTDAAIDFKWFEGSPDQLISPDTFSAHWAGNFTFVAGTYNFTAIADDGVRLTIDGTVILDKMIDQSEKWYTVPVMLTAGSHLIVLDYYENGGDATAKLFWGQ